MLAVRVGCNGARRCGKGTGNKVESGFEGGSLTQVDSMIKNVDVGKLAESGKDGRVLQTAAVVHEDHARDGARVKETAYELRQVRGRFVGRNQNDWPGFGCGRRRCL